MARRIHVPAVHLGVNELPSREAHHLLHVLRLQEGAAVEIFDDAGAIGMGVLQNGAVVVRQIQEVIQNDSQLILAAAIPKSGRADWLIEKLSELGVDTFVPLATERSVVIPEGKNKFDRWSRLAIEAAKQSQRAGVMRIAPVTLLPNALAEASGGEVWCLSTSNQAKPIFNQLRSAPHVGQLTLFIGPEGDWSDREVALFAERNAARISLGPIILRVETAALAAAAVVTMHRNRADVRQSNPAP